MDIETFIKAAKTIEPWIVNTPLITNDLLNERLGRVVYLKCENAQVTGSFKIRGCLYSMLTGDKTPRVARSSGNFAQAMAWSGQKLNIPTTIVMPKTAPLFKIEKTKSLGATVILTEPTLADQEAAVAKILQTGTYRYTPPSNEREVIIGQGTIALEVHDALKTVKHFLLPVGGGGLMSGAATAMKLLNKNVETVACEPLGANDFYLSMKAGVRTPITEIKTIADGLRAPYVGDLNWPLLKSHVDHVQTVTEEEILEAMRLIFETTGVVAEPSGAVSVAALLANKERFNEGSVVAVISGGNIDANEFERMITIKEQVLVDHNSNR